MRKIASIGVRDKIDAFNRMRDTPRVRNDKTFDPLGSEDGKSDGVVYKIRLRNGNREQWEPSQGILCWWLVPLGWRQNRHRGVVQVEKLNAFDTINQKSVIR